MIVLISALSGISAAVAMWVLAVWWSRHRRGETRFDLSVSRRKVLVLVATVFTALTTYFVADFLGDRSRLLLGVATAGLAVIVLVTSRVIKR